MRSHRCHALRQNAPATADIKRCFTFKSSHQLINVIKPQWIDFMQWFKFTIRIPPAVCELAEFFEFQWISIDTIIFHLYSSASNILRLWRYAHARKPYDTVAQAY